MIVLIKSSDRVLKQMTAHCFIYYCHKCFEPWNNYYCCCPVCKTYPRYCHQIFNEMSTYEDELEAITPLVFLIIEKFVGQDFQGSIYDGRNNFKIIKGSGRKSYSY